MGARRVLECGIGVTVKPRWLFDGFRPFLSLWKLALSVIAALLGGSFGVRSGLTQAVQACALRAGGKSITLGAFSSEAFPHSSAPTTCALPLHSRLRAPKMGIFLLYLGLFSLAHTPETSAIRSILPKRTVRFDLAVQWQPSLAVW